MNDPFKKNPAIGGRGLLIRVHNPAQIARGQGGVAALAQALAPETVEEKIYSEMAGRLKQALRNEGVDASVSIVDPSNFQSASGGLWKALAIGLGVLGAGYVGWRVVRK